MSDSDDEEGGSPTSVRTTMRSFVGSPRGQNHNRSDEELQVHFRHEAKEAKGELTKRYGY